MEFNLKGSSDPFLSINLEIGDRIFCESNSMISLDDGLELSAKVNGGILGSVAKKLFNNKSFFTQFIESKTKPGEVLLSPQLPSDIKVLSLSKDNPICLNDGSFLAATDGIDLNIKTQKIKIALFGGRGGLFITELNGDGQVAISGFGTIIEKKISHNSPLIVDNNFVVGWTKNLTQEITIKTINRNIFQNLFNSLKSGEIITNKFSGEGTVYLCSKNRNQYIHWLRYVTHITK